MHSLIAILTIAAGCAVAIIAGALLISRRDHRRRLFASYTEYFDNVMALALERDVVGAESALARLSRTTRRLELLESDNRCIHAIGMLVARCHSLVDALVGREPALVEDIVRLRWDISDRYGVALRLVRARLGFARDPVAAPSLRRNASDPRVSDN